VNPDELNHGLNRVKFQLRAEGVPDDTPNPLRSGIHSRGYLPHVKREGASYFVTFRLADSLPKQVLIRFEREREEKRRRLGAKATAEQAKEIERDFRRRWKDFWIGEWANVICAGLISRKWFRQRCFAFTNGNTCWMTGW